MTDPTVDTPTDPLFIAVAAILAAIDNGTIAEGEVIANEMREGRESVLTVIVRKEIRPIVVEGGDG